MTNEIEFYVDGSAINNENPNVRTLGGIGVYRRTNTENGINIITARPDQGWAINVADNDCGHSFRLSFTTETTTH